MPAKEVCHQGSFFPCGEAKVVHYIGQQHGLTRTQLACIHQSARVQAISPLLVLCLLRMERCVAGLSDLLPCYLMIVSGAEVEHSHILSFFSAGMRQTFKFC